MNTEEKKRRIEELEKEIADQELDEKIKSLEKKKFEKTTVGKIVNKLREKAKKLEIEDDDDSEEFVGIEADQDDDDE